MPDYNDKDLFGNPVPDPEYEDRDGRDKQIQERKEFMETQAKAAEIFNDIKEETEQRKAAEREAAKPLRHKILDSAINHVAVDRNKSYGEPRDNLGNTAMLWNSYLAGKYGYEFQINLTAEDVAWLNSLQKTSRSYNDKSRDTYEDAAGYAAIAGELAK